MAEDGVVFLSYRETLDLLSPAEALEVVEEVYRMHARGTVVWSSPPSLRMDTEAFHNHWHVKGCLLEDVPIAGLRLYAYYEDERRSTVGTLDSTRYIVLSDPRTGAPLAIVDEHWTFAIRSAAAATIACRWMANPAPEVLGLVGVGTMATNALRCLAAMYDFAEVRCTSRRPATREAFAARWSAALGIPVIAVETAEAAVRGADIAVGGTTSTGIVSREAWLKPGATFISLARRELDPEGWPRMDKIVLDDFEMNMQTPEFRETVARGWLSREGVHAEIAELVTGAKPGRERAEERVLIHTVGLVSQDVALAHYVYKKALGSGAGQRLPLAHLPEA